MTSLNFNLLEIRRNISEERDLVEYSAPSTIIFNPDTGKLSQIPAESREVLDLCDGKNSVIQIAEQLNSKFDAPISVIKKDCLAFLDSMSTNGYLSS